MWSMCYNRNEKNHWQEETRFLFVSSLYQKHSKTLKGKEDIRYETELEKYTLRVYHYWGLLP